MRTWFKSLNNIPLLYFLSANQWNDYRGEFVGDVIEDRGVKLGWVQRENKGLVVDGKSLWYPLPRSLTLEVLPIEHLLGLFIKDNVYFSLLFALDPPLVCLLLLHVYLQTCLPYQSSSHLGIHPFNFSILLICNCNIPQLLGKFQIGFLFFLWTHVSSMKEV